MKNQCFDTVISTFGINIQLCQIVLKEFQSKKKKTKEKKTNNKKAIQKAILFTVKEQLVSGDCDDMVIVCDKSAMYIFGTI